MAFESKTWVDGADGGTPITAEELNRMEQGIVDAQNVPVAFSDISGTASASQIPTLAQSKVTGLTAALADKASAQDLTDLAARVLALETAETE